MPMMTGPAVAPARPEVVERFRYLDNLKVLLVAGVIFGHAWAGYDQIGGWVYTQAREVSVAAATRLLAEAFLGPFGLFAMGVFFLIAGMLTPSSLRRKGPARFARDRLLRLGLPLAVFTIVVWPPVRYLLDHLAPQGQQESWRWPSADFSYLWFLVVLLLFSLGSAAWRGLRPFPRDDLRQELGMARLACIAAAIAVVSFTIRIWYPLGAAQYPDLHLSQWPQYLALFAVGMSAAHHHSLSPVPARLRRACGIIALAAAASVAVLALAAATANVPTQAFLGGGTWASLATATAEGILAVTVSVWLLGFAQRRLDRTWGHGHAARSAYAAFVLQGPVLVGLALALRPLPLAAEVKAAIVSVIGVLLTFRLARFAVTRTRLGRIL
jgi:hypothetical protein